VIGIVIVAHGGLAREYLAAMEHVIGKQDGAVAISISAECDREERRQAIFKAVEDVDCGYGVVVVTDIFGGTPSNLALAACEKPNRRVIYGATKSLSFLKLGISKACMRALRPSLSRLLRALMPEQWSALMAWSCPETRLWA